MRNQSDIVIAPLAVPLFSAVQWGGTSYNPSHCMAFVIYSVQTDRPGQLVERGLATS